MIEQIQVPPYGDEPATMQQASQSHPESPSDDSLRKPADPTLYWKLELHISCYERTQAMEVPLGQYVEGQWVPYEFTIWESGLTLDSDTLAYLLTENDHLGCVDIDDPEEANSAAQATIKRCLALAKASANNGRNRSHRGGALQRQR
jgi:hypothetical protein